MILMLFSLVFFSLSMLTALFTNKKIWLFSMVAASFLGIAAATKILINPINNTINIPWHIPLGNFSIEIDALSAIFILLICLFAPLYAIYGQSYLNHSDKKQLTIFYPLLIISMLFVVMAKNGFLFLLSWEIMSIAGYFLITFEDDEHSLKSGFIYLVATNIGMLFLLPFFLLLGNNNLDFQCLSGNSLIFLLGFIGFSTKAGVFPFHGWLPKAHPVAPSHVSALLSGVMIKMGIYGILRMIILLNEPQIIWGYICIVLGVFSALIGIFSALSQKELKTILAYSSIENIGIILLAIGLTIIGKSKDLPILTILALTATIFHIINHALFKGLLFLGAGAISKATQIKNINLLGGLHKKLPLLSGLFLIGVMSMTAMPLFNGFIGEFFLLLASLKGLLLGDFFAIIPLLSLCFIAALCFMLFSSVYSIIFLGEERSSFKLSKIPSPMLRIMGIIALLCTLFGTLPFVLFPIIKKAVFLFLPNVDIATLQESKTTLYKLSISFSIFFLVLMTLLLIRHQILKNRKIVITSTWGCGYDKITAKMQYNFSSFVQPIAFLFQKFFFHFSNHNLKDLFPKEENFLITPFDFLTKYFYKPLMEKLLLISEKTKKIQHGRTQFYIFYIFLTLVFLLLWKGQ